MKAKTGHTNKLLRYLTIPFRALGKAKDLYVRSMTSYATKVGYGADYAGTTSASYGGGGAVLPKSFSVNVSRSDENEDLRELIRAASVRSMAEKMDVNHLILDHQLGMLQRKELRPPPPPAAGKGMMPPRSVSVGMARIDEDKPDGGGAAVEGGGFGKGSKKGVLGMGRSKSHAVSKQRPGF